jgi:integral membrane protein
MTIAPRPEDAIRIRRVVAVFRVSAIVTGIFLLLLCVMMVLRYGLGVDIELGRPGDTFLTLTPRELIVGVDFSTTLLIIHGWLYVLYLGCDFLLWRYTRWSFSRFLFIALGGIVPLLSFFFETRVPRQALAVVNELDHVGVEKPLGVAS